MSISNDEALDAFKSLVGVAIRKDADTAWVVENVRPAQRTFTKPTYRATVELRGPWDVRVHVEVDEKVVKTAVGFEALVDLLKRKLAEHARDQHWYAQDTLRDKYAADLRIKA